jgi:hypothetical protein
MAFDLVQRCARALVYDVMDDLASFLKAPQGLRLRQRRALTDADVVFTGGRSLHRVGHAGAPRRGAPVPERRRDRPLRVVAAAAHARERKVAGYVGVIDERIDLDLVARLAPSSPTGRCASSGPIAKIDARSATQAPNLEYPGMVAYDDLPRDDGRLRRRADAVRAQRGDPVDQPRRRRWSTWPPGCRVVSTRVPGRRRRPLRGRAPGRRRRRVRRRVPDRSSTTRAPSADRRMRPILRVHEWDFIAGSMARLIDDRRPSATIDVRAIAGGTGVSAGAARPRSPRSWSRRTATAWAPRWPAAATWRWALRLPEPASLSWPRRPVTSATPFLRAPLLGASRRRCCSTRRPADDDATCPTCRTPAPCATVEVLR